MCRKTIYFILISIFISLTGLLIYLKVPDLYHTQYNRAQRAYIYAYPLVLMQITENIMTDNQRFINTLIHISEFPTPTFTSIVRPNIDTLYSFAWLDLRYGPIIVSVPDTNQRYYLIELLDAWTNVFGSLGKRTTGTTAQDFIITGPGWSGEIPSRYIHISAPTNMVLLLLRILTYGKEDYDQVHQLQQKFSLRTCHDSLLSIFFDTTTLSKLSVPVDVIAAMDAQTFYTLYATTVQYNPPAPADKPIVDILQNFGIEPGKKFTGNSANQEILDRAMASAYNTIATFKDTISTHNGWSMIKTIGIYGTDYLTRAMVAYIGIGANIRKDALYPTTFVDAYNKPLIGKYAYRIHFNKEQLPAARAFWSITLYNEKSFLVQNKWNKYGINNNDPLHYNDDGSLDIYIQKSYPGKDKENNWIPAPTTPFNLTMRLYWPEERALDGSWLPPTVEKRG